MLRSREITSVELTTAVLEHIAAHEERLHAFIHLMGDSAMEEAKQADAEIAAGGVKGPMHGVPIALKDLYAVAGVPNMAGSQALEDNVPDEDCTVVRRFREAGAVILGKLNTTEGAMGGYNEHLQPGQQLPVNPWDPEAWAGASSSGSGVATAAGFGFTTLGSDTGGSIRFPSAACGTVGIKPTWGRVSRHGVLDLAQTLDHVGPMSRCTADAAITLQIIAGPDENDPTSLPEPPLRVFTGGADWALKLDGPLELGGRRLRIGVDAVYNTTDGHPELTASVEEATRTLAAATGGEIVAVSMPPAEKLAQFINAWGVLCAPEAVHAHTEAGTWPSRKAQYGTWFRKWLEDGEAVTGAEYAAARILREQLCGHIAKMFAQHELDVLVCPAMNSPPFQDLRAHQPELLLSDTDWSLRECPWGKYTIPFDYSGQPTITLCTGLTDTAPPKPLAVQIVGRHLQEELLCKLGHAYERAVGRQRAPLVPPSVLG